MGLRPSSPESGRPFVFSVFHLLPFSPPKRVSTFLFCFEKSNIFFPFTDRDPSPSWRSIKLFPFFFPTPQWFFLFLGYEAGFFSFSPSRRKRDVAFLFSPREVVVPFLSLLKDLPSSEGTSPRPLSLLSAILPFFRKPLIFRSSELSVPYVAPPLLKGTNLFSRRESALTFSPFDELSCFQYEGLPPEKGNPPPPFFPLAPEKGSFFFPPSSTKEGLFP